ncbi:MAG: gephyrin-like molybdotransferase Glp [Candidatus Acidiferrales bacterium]
MLSHQAARAIVIEEVGARVRAAAANAETSPVELVPVELANVAQEAACAIGRVLAEDIPADRNYPSFDRSLRDGFALRAADAAEPGARLRLIGESRAGVPFAESVPPGSCIEIMTGAALPAGTDAVAMLEYARAEGDFVIFEQLARAGQHVVREAAEHRAGQLVLQRGTRLGYPELALAAQMGRASLRVTRRPRVAILSTGDEVVGVEQFASKFQIRNSNSIALSAQVSLAGGEPVPLGNARDDRADLRRQIELGLAADMLVLTGGVSVGKYDLVEPVLRGLGAEFFFDAVAIRPGRPAVFGVCREKPVFGLPGNPVSTMVSFELLAVPAIDILGGSAPRALPLLRARLRHDVDEKGPLAHFLPALLAWSAGEGEPSVQTLRWHGSGDIGAVGQGNCFLVVHESRLKLAAGEWVDVLPYRGRL